MPVEKMEMISVIGRAPDVDIVSQEMVKCGCIHVVNAREDIKYNAGDKYKNIEKIMNQYNGPKEYHKARELVYSAMEVLGLKKAPDRKYIDDTLDFDYILAKLTPVYEEALKAKRKLDKSQGDINKIMELEDKTKDIKGLTFALSELRKLRFFSFKVGKFSRHYYVKLKENIENVPSIVYKLGSTRNYVTVISFTPASSLNKTEEIFKSLGFEEILIPEIIKGVPGNVIKRFDEIIEERLKRVEELKNDIEAIRQKHGEFVEQCFSFIKKYEKAHNIINEALSTGHVFYVSGWIPSSCKTELLKNLNPYRDKMITAFRPQHEVKAAVPPTVLKNNPVFKPFEYLVSMYGIPGYNEVDPTSFVAISYMIMFGAMFGDVGQGFVLLCAGLYLSILKKVKDFGGILTSVGLSSMVFGFLYGSVFGNEELIHPLLFRPLENINIMLFGSVIFGIVLSAISYFINFINSARLHDIEDGVFGREGVFAFLFYTTVLMSAYSLYRYGRLLISPWIVGIILAVFLLLIIIKEPLTRLIEGKRPLYKASAGDYYVESIFGVIETLLGMLSKTISFVRLGAFALNHTGLFVAFQTVAGMIRNRAGGVGVMVLGNIIIIFLEGLVVFIQGLRLEYYELFSRFYKGDGIEYRPVHLDFKKEP